MSEQKNALVNKLIDNCVTPEQKPKDWKDGELWATHSGVLKLGEIELRCYVLSNGMRVFDEKDIEKLFSGELQNLLP